jgi:hypothetical protein
MKIQNHQKILKIQQTTLKNIVAVVEKFYSNEIFKRIYEPVSFFVKPPLQTNV